jgi:hypothetical protein
MFFVYLNILILKKNEKFWSLNFQFLILIRTFFKSSRIMLQMTYFKDIIIKILKYYSFDYLTI